MLRFVMAFSMVLGALAAPARAGSITSLLAYDGSQSYLSDNSLEVLWKEGANGWDVADIGNTSLGTTLEVGDRLVAIARIDQVKSAATGNTDVLFGNGGWTDETTVIAVTEVIHIDQYLTPQGQRWDFHFGAASDVDPLGLGWSADTMVAFYSDPASDWTINPTSIQDGIDRATGGTALWEFGDDSAIGNAFWLAEGVATNNVLAVGVSGVSAGNFNLGLNLIARNAGPQLITLPGGLHLIGNGNFRTADEPEPWQLTDDINFTMAAVPEPSSLAIWGVIGVVGVVAARRRSRSRDAAVANCGV